MGFLSNIFGKKRVSDDELKETLEEAIALVRQEIVMASLKERREKIRKTVEDGKMTAIIKLDPTSLSGREYPKMYECRRKNLDIIASLTASTILYNLSFLPPEVLSESFTHEMIAAFAYLYPRYRFVTESNLWEEATPEKTLDVNDVLVVTDLVCSILRYNKVAFSDPLKCKDLPYFQHWKKGVFLDKIRGTIGIATVPEGDYVYFDKAVVDRLCTGPLAFIEHVMQERTGENRIRYMEQGVKTPFDFQASYEFEV